ncbi:MAG: molybdate ABC transporter permease subunit [Haloarculaceae archaeon]
MAPFRRRSASDRALASPRAVAALLGAVLLGYYLLPLASLAATQSPGAVLARLRDPAVVDAALLSLTAAAITTLASLAFGLPLAYWLSTASGRLRTAVTAAVALPLVVPPVVSGMLLLPVVGTGPIAAGFRSLGLSTTRSLLAVVLAQTFVASPYLVITSLAAFERVDDRYVEAALTQGASPARAFRRIALPLARTGIAAGVTLTFARAMGEFGATMMLAYRPRTLPVSIWTSFLGRGTDAAFPLAVVLLAVSVIALAVVRLAGTGLPGTG